jgi:hypothetical protein
LAVVLVAGLVYGFGRIARPSYQPMAAAEMVQVIDKQFVNESVEVDGKNFVGCTFTGVRFIFRGRKEFRMAEGTFEGPVVIQTDGDESRFALAFVINMLRDLKMVKPTEVGFKDENLVIQKAPEPIKPQ